MSPKRLCHRAGVAAGIAATARTGPAAKPDIFLGVAAGRDSHILASKDLAESGSGLARHPQKPRGFS